MLSYTSKKGNEGPESAYNTKTILESLQSVSAATKMKNEFKDRGLCLFYSINVSLAKISQLRPTSIQHQ